MLDRDKGLHSNGLLDVKSLENNSYTYDKAWNITSMEYIRL